MIDRKQGVGSDAVGMFDVLAMLDTWAPCPECTGEPMVAHGRFPYEYYDGEDFISDVDTFALVTRHRPRCTMEHSEHSEPGMFVHSDPYLNVYDSHHHAMAGVTKLMAILVRRYGRDRCEAHDELAADMQEDRAAS